MSISMSKGVQKDKFCTFMVVCCDVQLVLSHVGLMRIRCTTIRKLPRLSFFHNPVDNTFHEELHGHFFFLKSMYLLESQKCINYSIQRIAKRHLRRSTRATKGGGRCELRGDPFDFLGRGSHEGGEVMAGSFSWRRLGGVSGQILRLCCIHF